MNRNDQAAYRRTVALLTLASGAIALFDVYQLLTAGA
jgi:hypothetical protein